MNGVELKWNNEACKNQANVFMNEYEHYKAKGKLTLLGSQLQGLIEIYPEDKANIINLMSVVAPQRIKNVSTKKHLVSRKNKQLPTDDCDGCMDDKKDQTAVKKKSFGSNRTKKVRKNRPVEIRETRTREFVNGEKTFDSHLDKFPEPPKVEDHNDPILTKPDPVIPKEEVKIDPMNIDYFDLDDTAVLRARYADNKNPELYRIQLAAEFNSHTGESIPEEIMKAARVNKIENWIIKNMPAMKAKYIIE